MVAGLHDRAESVYEGFRLMRDPSKADSVDIVRVLELLFDPDKLLMQLRSNDTISRDFHRWILSLTSS